MSPFLSFFAVSWHFTLFAAFSLKAQVLPPPVSLKNKGRQSSSLPCSEGLHQTGDATLGIAGSSAGTPPPRDTCLLPY